MDHNRDSKQYDEPHRSEDRFFLGRRSRFAVVILLAILAILALGVAYLQFPHGYAHLAALERQLEESLPLGTQHDSAKSVLKAAGVMYREWTANKEEVVSKNPTRREVVAQSGDQVVYARFATGAWRFPCSIDLNVVLVFGPDGKLQQREVSRFRRCP